MSIKVKNYKCFQNEIQGFEKILPINIIIGKNNSGKSSLIDIIEDLCTKAGSIKEIYSEFNPDLDDFLELFYEVYGRGQNILESRYVYENKVKKNKIVYIYNRALSIPGFTLIDDKKINSFSTNDHGYDLRSIFSKLNFIDFTEFKFRRLNAERNINPESASQEILIKNNGEGATNTIQQFYNRIDLQLQKIIKHDFLAVLNSIVNPEIELLKMQ